MNYVILININYKYDNRRTIRRIRILNIMSEIKLYYQVDDKNYPMWDFCASAMIGAKEENIEAIPFKDVSEIKYNNLNVVVGSVEQTLKYLDKEITIIDHSWCWDFFKRGINLRYICEIYDKEFPTFIKPAREIKGFTGFVAINKKDAIQNSNNYQGKIVSQQVVQIESECRVYVDKNRGILGVKHYLGDPFITLDKNFVQTCVKKSREKLNEISYTLDFGINEKGETFLIEVNDGWAIGNYGLDAKTYYHFLKNRFLQLNGVLS